jgi:PAS domain S-box-containing protein
MAQETASAYGTIRFGEVGEAGLHGKSADREHPTHEYVRLHGMLSEPGNVAYRYNFITNRFDYVSPEIMALLGFSEEEWLVMDTREAIDRLHPDDYLKVGDELRAIIQGGSTIIEYRFLGKDGAYRWLNDRIEIVTDADERPRYRVGVLRGSTRQAEVMEGTTLGAPVEGRRLVARWIEDARKITSTPRRGFRGSRAAAMAAGLLLLLGGAYAYHMMRGITASPGPAGESQVTPSPETQLARQVGSLTADRDRLERRVKTLERRLAAARKPLGTAVHPAVAAIPGPVTTEAPGTQRPKAPAESTMQVLAFFRGPAHQQIAPDPPSNH